jgi:poly(3-hydroxybutyrate) depolymerase
MPNMKPCPLQRLLMLLVLTLVWLQGVIAAEQEILIESRSGSFLYVDAKGDTSKQLTVYTYLPTGLNPKEAPIVFVMHGAGKDARGMRDTWIEHANNYGFMVIAPRFDSAQWGSGAYSYASVINKAGELQDPAKWSYNVIEHLFDDIKSATGNPAATYFIYGHSEGAQFVHRLVSFLPDARYSRAVAANAGWYMMPTFDVKYPHGLAGAPVSRAPLKKILGRDFVIMLGDRDTDPNHWQLSKTPQAMAQGANRFERGQNYFKEAGNRASELQCSFGWRLQVVPFAAHENSKMSRPAAAVLMRR